MRKGRDEKHTHRSIVQNLWKLQNILKIKKNSPLSAGLGKELCNEVEKIQIDTRAPCKFTMKTVMAKKGKQRRCLRSRGLGGGCRAERTHIEGLSQGIRENEGFSNPDVSPTYT